MMLILIIVVPATAAPPVITLLGRDPTSLSVGSIGYFDPGAIAIDPVFGDLTGSIVVTNDVNVSAVGTYSVNYTVTNPNAESATQPG